MGGDTFKIVTGIIFPPLGVYYGLRAAGLPSWAAAIVNPVGAIANKYAVMGQAMLAGTPGAPNSPLLGSGNLNGSPTYGFQGIQNSTRLGSPIGLVYGTHRVGGQIISLSVVTKDDTDMLHMLISLGEGTIQSITSIQINNQDVANYKGVITDTRLGANVQSPIGLFGDKSITTFSNDVTLGTTWSGYTTNGTNLNAFEVQITFPGGLFNIDSSGNFSSASVTVQVQYRITGTTPWTAAPDTIYTDAKRSVLRRTIRIDSLTPGQYDIQVQRTTAQSISPRLVDEVHRVGINEIVNDAYSYPNTALLAVEALATNQLSGGVPTITALVQGRIIRVFSALDTYTWVFNNNPAWVVFDVLTNARYGMGNFIWPITYKTGTITVTNASAAVVGVGTAFLSNVIKGDKIVVDAQGKVGTVLSIADDTHLTLSSNWTGVTLGAAAYEVHRNDLDIQSFLDWSAFCDQMVPNGVGGTEKRAMIDIVLDADNLRLWDTVIRLCGIGQASPVKLGWYIRIKIDQPSSTVQLFAMSNIVRGTFNETFLAMKDLSNLFEIQYLNAANSYQQDLVELEDPLLFTNSEPVRKQTVNYYGITRTSHALRLARFLQKVNRYIARTIVFEVGLDGVNCEPGDVVKFQHDVPQWGYGGRCLAGVAGIVRLDIGVPIPTNHEIVVRHVDDTIETQSVSSMSAWDEGVNALHGTYFGTVTLGTAGALPGDPDTGVTLPNTGGRINLGSTALLKPAGAFSIEAWVNVADISALTNYEIFSSETYLASGILLRVNASGSGVIHFRTSQAGTATSINSIAVLTINTWYHVVATFDGTTARIYINGTLNASGPMTAPVAATAIAAWGFGTASQQFWGILDEGAFYGVALSPTQVASHYAARLNTSYRATVLADSPVGYWRFNEGNRSALNITGNWTTIPSKGDPWAYGAVSISTKPFRITAIERTQELTAKLTATEYNAAIYDDSAFSPVNIVNYSALADMNGPPGPVKNLTILQQNLTIQSVWVSFTPPGSANFKTARIYRSDSGVDVYLGDSISGAFPISGLASGTLLTIKVTTVSQLGVEGSRTTAPTASIVLGQVHPPDITNVTSTYESFISYLSWPAVSWISPIQYEVRMGTSWDSAMVMGRTPNTRVVSAGDGTYWIAAMDTSGSYSINPASFVLSGATLTQNVIKTMDEVANGWTGTLSGSAVAVDGTLTVAGVGLFDDLADVDGFLTYLDYYGGLSLATGYYDIPVSEIVDLGVSKPVGLSVVYAFNGVSTGTLFDVIADFDSLATLDLYFGAWIAVIMQVAVAGNDGIFGAWQDLVLGQYYGRKFKFRVSIATLDVTVQPIISALKFVVDMPDRVEMSSGVSVLAGGTTVTYATAFQSTPAVHVTIVGATAGDDVVLTAQGVNGFTMQVVNGGVGVARTVNWSSHGY